MKQPLITIVHEGLHCDGHPTCLDRQHPAQFPATESFSGQLLLSAHYPSRPTLASSAGSSFFAPVLNTKRYGTAARPCSSLKF